jgi:transcriptional regulator with XRE-family HTH domain
MHPLKAARKERGLSLCQVAIRIGLPANKSGMSQVNRWENGACIPGPERAAKLAALFGFGSGDHVQHLCQSWQEEHYPKHARKKPNNPPQNKGSKEPHPLDLRQKLHPLKEYRKIRGFSLHELAVKLGFPSNKASGRQGLLTGNAVSVFQDMIGQKSSPTSWDLNQLTRSYRNARSGATQKRKENDHCRHQCSTLDTIVTL